MLRKVHVEKIAHAITASLAAEHHLKAAEEAVAGRIISLIGENMDAERALDDEAHKLLDKNRKMIGGDIDESRAFAMIKKQLAKQKGFTL